MARLGVRNKISAEASMALRREKAQLSINETNGLRRGLGGTVCGCQSFGASQPLSKAVSNLAV